MKSNSQQAAVQSNLLARLDRIPITKSVIGIIALLSLVWLAEAFDIGIVGPVLTTLEKAWHLNHNQTGLLGVASTLGVVMGMIPSGYLSDRIGRRSVVLWGILFFSILTLAGTLVSSYQGLFTVRLLAGIGEGAVLPMPYLFLSEFVRTKRRAISVGYSNGILTAAYLIPNLASVWALNQFPINISWRIPFLMGGVPLLVVIPLYFWLPESPRFLLRKNRTQELQTLIERLETEAHIPHDKTLRNNDALTALRATSQSMQGLKLLLHRPYLGRTLLVVSQLTGALMLFYILQVFGPTLLVARGFSSSHAILYTGLMMGTAGIGSIAQGYLSDRLGRKLVLTSYVFLASIGCLLFAVAASPACATTAAFLTSFFGLGVFPVSKLCVAEQYPAEMRGGGVYLNEIVARTLSGVVTLYFIPYLLDLYSNQVLFFGIGIAFVILAIPYALWGRETYNITVEEAGTRVSLAHSH